MEIEVPFTAFIYEKQYLKMTTSCISRDISFVKMFNDILTNYTHIFKI